MTFRYIPRVQIVVQGHRAGIKLIRDVDGAVCSRKADNVCFND